ncbi:MAG: hypothetical protein D6766_05830 [Verrucomicrobia bacterium]|nr:MAG: hypothetical protein D6766_05830 [Verrucomicrobiota bacterium]
MASSYQRPFHGNFHGVRWFITMERINTPVYLDPSGRRRHEQFAAEAKAKTGFSGRDISFEVSCDGTNTFLVCILGDRAALCGAHVNPGVIPIHDCFSLAHPVWLAYGSSLAFDADGDQPFRPLFPLNGPEDAFYDGPLLATRVTRADAPPHLPLLVEQFAPAPAPLPGGRAPVAQDTGRKDPPGGREFLKVRYRVLETARWRNLVLPRRFELALFAPGDPRAGDPVASPDLLEVYEGEATQFEAAPEHAEYRPSLGSGTWPPRIIDGRLRLDGRRVVVGYTATNWLTAEQAAALPEVQHYLQLEKRARAAVRPAGRVWHLFLGLSLAPPIVLLLLRQFAHKPQRERKGI